jgi:hypothetical protein
VDTLGPSERARCHRLLDPGRALRSRPTRGESGVDGDALGAEYDGNELAVDGSEARFFLYGDDADALYDAVAPVVGRADLEAGSYAIKRYGGADDPSAREERVSLK